MSSRVARAFTVAAFAAFVALGALAPVRAFAQEDGGTAPPPPPSKIVRIEKVKVHDLEKDNTVEVKIELEVLDSWHVNAHQPKEDFLVPTVLELPKGTGVKVNAIRYPDPKSVKLSFSETELLVYEHDFDLHVVFDVAPGAAAQTLKGKLRFQSCNDQICLPPASIPIAIELPAGASGAAGGAAKGAKATETSAAQPAPSQAANPDTAASVSGSAESAPPSGGAAEPPPAPAAGAAPGGASAPEQPNLVTTWFDEKGSILAFVFIFLMGLGLNLTPCVYPMMGVTVSLFGASAASSATAAGGAAAAAKKSALPRAIVYVLGIALMYSSLGVVAATTGNMFGGWLANPIVLAGIGLLLLAMALSMFGLYELQVPSGIMVRLGGAAGTSVLGTFLAGLLVGVFAAPCIGPPIIALLAHVGAKGDPLYGFWAFFVLSLGLGLPYLVLGASSGLLTKLPKSGSWMDWVKHLFGVILLGVAAFYLCLAFAPSKVAWVVPLALLLGGVYLGFLEATGRDKPGFRRFKWAVGTFAIVAAALVAFRPAPATQLTWVPYTEAALAKAKADGKPVLIDFTADWCIPCHELEEQTFSDAAVVKEAQGFVCLQVDLTREGEHEAEAARKRFGVPAPPIVIFIGGDGNEVANTRLAGFVKPHVFVERVRAARIASNLAER
jgi:thiol:disulfide interchange protein DsbD